MDIKLGIRNFTAAAAQGNPAAMFALARCWAAGVGVEKNLAKARQLRDKLARAHGAVAALEIKKLDELIAKMAEPVDSGTEGKDRPPRIFWHEKPYYPPACARSGLEGHVEVEFIIGVDGHTRDVKVVGSSDKQFEGSAVVAVSFWRFHPSCKDGRLVDVRAHQLIEFTLDKESGAEMQSVDQHPEEEIILTEPLTAVPKIAE